MRPLRGRYHSPSQARCGSLTPKCGRSRLSSMQCGFGSVFGSEQTIGLFSIRSIDNFFFVVARYKLQPELFSFLQIENASPSTGLHLEPRIRCRTPQCEPKRTTPFFYPLRPPFPFRSMQATFPLCLTFPDDALPPRIF